jgi:hypothetical protein
MQELGQINFCKKRLYLKDKTWLSLIKKNSSIHRIGTLNLHWNGTRAANVPEHGSGRKSDSRLFASI